MRHAISPRFATSTRRIMPMRRSVPDEDADRRRVPAVARIVDLRAVRDHRRARPSRRASRRRRPGRETPSTMSRWPVSVTGTFMKKLMLLTRSRFPMPWRASAIRKLSRQLCMYCLSWPKRQVLLSALHAPPEVSWRPQVSATIVEHRTALARAQHAAGREEDVALRPDRLGRAVALARVGGDVEERVDGLVALEVDDAERLAAPHEVRPRLARRDDDVEARLLRAPHAFDEGGHAKSASVLRKPRRASSEDVRQRSSAAGGGDCQTTSRIGFGSYVGAGWSGCGVFESATNTFISARRSMKAPGLLAAVHPLERAARCDPHAREEVQVRHHVARPEPVASERVEEVGAGVAMAAVTEVLVVALAVAGAVRLRRAAAAEGVVVAARVGGDREEHPPHVGEEHPARRQEDHVLDLHGVGGVVALGRVVGVVAETARRPVSLRDRRSAASCDGG